MDIVNRTTPTLLFFCFSLNYSLIKKLSASKINKVNFKLESLPFQPQEEKKLGTPIPSNPAVTNFSLKANALHVLHPSSKLRRSYPSFVAFGYQAVLLKFLGLIFPSCGWNLEKLKFLQARLKKFYPTPRNFNFSWGRPGSLIGVPTPRNLNFSWGPYPNQGTWPKKNLILSTNATNFSYTNTFGGCGWMDGACFVWGRGPYYPKVRSAAKEGKGCKDRSKINSIHLWWKGGQYILARFPYGKAIPDLVLLLWRESSKATPNLEAASSSPFLGTGSPFPSLLVWFHSLASNSIFYKPLPPMLSVGSTHPPKVCFLRIALVDVDTALGSVWGCEAREWNQTKRDGNGSYKGKKLLPLWGWSAGQDQNIKEETATRVSLKAWLKKSLIKNYYFYNSISLLTKKKSHKKLKQLVKTNKNYNNVINGCYAPFHQRWMDGEYNKTGSQAYKLLTFKHSLKFSLTPFQFPISSIPLPFLLAVFSLASCIASCGPHSSPSIPIPSYGCFLSLLRTGRMACAARDGRFVSIYKRAGPQEGKKARSPFSCYARPKRPSPCQLCILSLPALLRIRRKQSTGRMRSRAGRALREKKVASLLGFTNINQIHSCSKYYDKAVFKMKFRPCNVIKSGNCFRNHKSIFYKLLWKWTQKRHFNKSYKWLIKEYFKKINGKKWVFVHRLCLRASLHSLASCYLSYKRLPYYPCFLSFPLASNSIFYKPLLLKFLVSKLARNFNFSCKLAYKKNLTPKVCVAKVEKVYGDGKKSAQVECIAKERVAKSEKQGRGKEQSLKLSLINKEKNQFYLTLPTFGEIDITNKKKILKKYSNYEANLVYWAYLN